MKMHITPFLSSLLVSCLLIQLNCARKPGKDTEYGSDVNVFLKADFENKEFVVGQKNGPQDLFINAARDKEKSSSTNLHLIANLGDEIADGKKVYFTITETFLSMKFVGSDNPVAQWSGLNHCRLEVKKNAKGEETRFNSWNCATEASASDLPGFRADFNSVAVRDVTNGLEKFLPKSMFLGEKGNSLTSQIFTVKTGKFKNKGLAVTHARELVLGKGFTDFNDLRPVSFDAPDIPLINFSDQILKDVEFLGREDSEYQVRFRLTDHFMLVEKVVGVEDLGPQEKTYAQDIGNGSYAVTLVGYPIGKVELEPTIVAGEKTVGLTAVAVQGIDQTTHLKIDENSPQKFRSIPKLDVFPADFFKEGDEWFFETSLLDRPLDTILSGVLKNIYPGTQFKAGRARVYKNKNSIQFLDTNIPEDAAGADGEKLLTMMEIPAEWIDYRIVSTGAWADLEEESLVDGDAGANEWNKRKFAIFKFQKTDNLNSATSDQFKLKRLEIAENYISFDITSGGVTIKYSLKKASSNAISGRTYPRDDIHTYGFRGNVRSSYANLLDDFQEKMDLKTVLGRMYPERDPANGNKPTIWIHLAKNKQNDPFLVEGVKDAVLAWDKAFAKAAEGTGKEAISVKFSEDLVESSDIRYNTVVFWGYDYATDPSGYGPSVMDQNTGEIVNASNHIFLRRYRDVIFGDIREYVRHELGFYKGAEIKGINIDQTPSFIGIGSELDIGGASQGKTSSELMSSLPYTSKNNDLNVEKNQFDASQLFNINPLASIRPFLSNWPLTQKINIQPEKSSEELAHVQRQAEKIAEYVKKLGSSAAVLSGKNSNAGCDYPINKINTFTDIKELCDSDGAVGEIFHTYLDKLKSEQKDGIYLSHLGDEDTPAYVKCAEALMRRRIASTLTHEFGHNFGMRHNFAGSADGDNYLKSADGKILARSSTVMEYPFGDEDRLLVPGSYDIAAIRYAYYDAVEVKDSQGSKLIPLDTRKPILANLEDAGVSSESLKTYLFCDDNEMDSMDPADVYGAQFPLEKWYCRRWDRGATHTDRVRSSINNLLGTAMRLKKRFDGVKISDQFKLADYLWKSDMSVLKITYNYFRRELAKIIENQTSGKDPYLNHIVNQEQIDQLVENSGNADLKDAYQASRLAFDFLEQIAFSPVMYCVVTSSSDPSFILALSFEKLRRDIYLSTEINKGRGVTVNNCQEATPHILERPELAGKNSLKVDTVGNLLNDLQLSGNPTTLNDGVYPIEMGLLAFRAYASVKMLIREVTSVVDNGLFFKPTFLDEPEFRRRLINRFTQRIVSGEEVLKWVPGHEDSDLRSLFIADEAPLYGLMYKTLLENLNVDTTNDRISAFRPNSISPTDLQQLGGTAYFDKIGAVYIVNASGVYYYSTEANKIAYDLIKRINTINELKTTAITSENQMMPILKLLAGIVITMDASLRASDLPEDILASQETLTKWIKSIQGLINSLMVQGLETIDDILIKRELTANAPQIKNLLLEVIVGDLARLDNLADPNIKRILIGEYDKNKISDQDFWELFAKAVQTRLIWDLEDYKQFEANQSEINAQSDLLTKIILSF